MTTTLPGGEHITSEPDSDSNAIAVYLRLQASPKVERVWADYKFSLLDLAGTTAYELPPETGIFTSASYSYGGDDEGVAAGNLGCGYATFITKEELERRWDNLLREDSLAVRCDVGVMEMGPMAIAIKHKKNDAGGKDEACARGGSESPDEYDGDGRRSQLLPSDAEYIRRCLTAHR
uniref:MATH domain-containing protein n=1 Tax=Setaria viridis TaxID=4556 RepID=A0A4U6U439_SETVI|nr:hypothetical protein SEVIR_6G055200v2 [Setaria viridis]